MFNPYANTPRLNRRIVYRGTCLTAGIRLARASRLNVRAVPTIMRIDELVEVAQEIYRRVFSKVPQERWPQGFA